MADYIYIRDFPLMPFLCVALCWAIIPLSADTIGLAGSRRSAYTIHRVGIIGVGFTPHITVVLG